MEIKTTTIILITMIGLFSCNSSSSDFWTDYSKVNLKEDYSKHGSRGGNSAIHWSADSTTFTFQQIKKYAEENNWEFIEGIEVNAEEVSKWSYNAKPIFPLSHEGFSKIISTNFSTYDKFPRWINGDATVYLFKTGRVMIVPGTDDINEVNGFVLLNKDGNEMSVYHLWGD